MDVEGSNVLQTYKKTPHTIGEKHLPTGCTLTPCIMPKYPPSQEPIHVSMREISEKAAPFF